MECNISKSKICSFYKDKNIFITGGTGFVGKLLVEKLLRTCSPKKIYLLIRPKKSVDPQDRLKELFQAPIFEKLKASVPDYMQRVTLVNGDISLPGIGIADMDVVALSEVINIVIHCAATVKFDEHLTPATWINVRGTKAVLDLCKKIKYLESVVHVSTAFSFCVHKDINEEFYDTPISGENLIKLCESLKESQIEKIAPYILDKWPNTYAFTKAIAEDVVRTNSKGLPISIFRPGIIVSTHDEPVKGWIDNLYGPIGATVGSGAGVIRVLRLSGNCKADIVPADMVVNAIMAVGYKTGVCQPALNIPIYNFTTHKDNIVKWADYISTCRERGMQVPSAQALWYYVSITTKTWYSYLFLCFLLHTLPALLVDIGFVICNKKPKALKIYKKVHKFSEVIAYFGIRSWNFNSDNVNSLWKTLGEEDQALFNFDMLTLNWTRFLHNSVDGLRLYMFKESPETLPYARKKFFMLMILHRALQCIFFGGLGWCIWSLSLLLKRTIFT